MGWLGQRGPRDLAMVLATRLMPRRFIYWCVVRCLNHATTGKHAGTSSEADKQGMMPVAEMMRRWEGK